MRDLTKWPRLIVVPVRPAPVTREQASNILLRTTGWMFSNDRPWVTAVGQVLGIETDGHGWFDLRSAKAFRDSIDGLDLHYLHNDRIMSTWIGGPRGWCDWDGNLGCATWNVGKWPTYEEISEDWSTIAAAFPYLDLHAQLITDEGTGDVAGQWRVTDGKAALVEPAGRYQPEDLHPAEVLFRVIGCHGERGVTLDRLREAMTHVRAASGTVRGSGLTRSTAS